MFKPFRSHNGLLGWVFGCVLEALHRFLRGFLQRGASMRALWSDRQNCSHNVSQKVKRIRRLSHIFGCNLTWWALKRQESSKMPSFIVKYGPKRQPQDRGGFSCIFGFFFLNFFVFPPCFSLFPAVSCNLGTPKQPNKWGYRLFGCNLTCLQFASAIFMTGSQNFLLICNFWIRSPIKGGCNAHPRCQFKSSGGSPSEAHSPLRGSPRKSKLPLGGYSEGPLQGSPRGYAGLCGIFQG